MTDTIIPIVKPTLFDWEAVIAEFREAWESGQVTTGRFTRLFEVAVEEKLHVSHAIMVQSCTAGLMLLIRALQLKDEILMPAFTWTATAHAVVWNGLKPVFVDIRPDTFTLDPEKVLAAINPKTAAIIPVNVFGCPPDYEAFAEIGARYNFPVLYDSAQGLGSKYSDTSGNWRHAGNFGIAEVFSLSPTKVVSAMEGGVITTHNTELAQELRQMRDYGKTPDGEDIAYFGLSARVPEINAIVARHNLAHIDELIARRHHLIQSYKEGVAGLKGVTFQEIPSNRISSGNYFTIFIDPDKAKNNRDTVYQYLKDKGIQSKKYFYPALHLQKVYQHIGQDFVGKLPITERVALQGLALPMFSHISQDHLNKVIEAVREVL